jgi:hypothetical protein
MLSADQYINLLTSLHWGQLIKFKWYFEEILNEPLYLAPFHKSEIVDEDCMMLDVQTLFTLYFQEGQQNQINDQSPLVEIYKKSGQRYTALRKVIKDFKLEFPSMKELRKIKPSSNKEYIEV